MEEEEEEEEEEIEVNVEGDEYEQKGDCLVVERNIHVCQRPSAGRQMLETGAPACRQSRT